MFGGDSCLCERYIDSKRKDLFSKTNSIESTIPV